MIPYQNIGLSPGWSSRSNSSIYCKSNLLSDNVVKSASVYKLINTFYLDGTMLTMKNTKLIILMLKNNRVERNSHARVKIFLLFD